MAQQAANQGRQQENYGRLLSAGVLLSVFLMAGLAAYWLGDSNRLASAAGRLLDGRVARGGETFSSQCVACHGASGEGGVGPALNSKTLLKNTPDAIFFSVIRSGVPNTQMPSWSVDFGGPLTDEDIRDVVAFVRAWEPTAPEITVQAAAPDPALGAVLFASTCAICHGEGGKGGRVGVPALNDPVRLVKFDDAWYRGVIANGRPAKGMPTWGTVLSPAQLEDLVALIGAWRQGQQVAPSFSVTDLLDRALFALTQNDPASAKLQAGRALGLTSGVSADVLRSALAQIEAGDLQGASASLQTLKDQWPLGDPATGAALYTANCQACHGPQGEGGIGLPLQPSAFVQSQNNSELVKFIGDGRPGTAMAGFTGRMSEAEMADLVAFLREWQK
jgi:mono/diheme cytochrome c family protein